MNISFLDLMDHASDGKKVLIVGKRLQPMTTTVGRGVVHFRNHDVSGLKTVEADTVWFVDYPTAEVEKLCRERTRTSLHPVFL